MLSAAHWPRADVHLARPEVRQVLVLDEVGPGATELRLHVPSKLNRTASKGHYSKQPLWNRANCGPVRAALQDRPRRHDGVPGHEQDLPGEGLHALGEGDPQDR